LVLRLLFFFPLLPKLKCVAGCAEVTLLQQGALSVCLSARPPPPSLLLQSQQLLLAVDGERPQLPVLLHLHPLLAVLYDPGGERGRDQTRRYSIGSHDPLIRGE